MEIRQLRALVAVVDEGTFTDAAIALHTSQATVSRAVAALESELGVRLLRRTPRGATPTTPGRLALGHARRVLHECDRLVEQLADAGDELRVGFAWSALGRHTLPLQRAWTTRHPGSQIVFVQANTVTAGLAEGLAELVVTRRQPTDPRIRAAVIGVEHRYAALGEADPLARRRTVVLSDFTGRTVAVNARSGTTTIDLWAAGSSPAGTRDTQGLEEWLTTIASGQAIGMTTEATRHQHPRPDVAYRRVRDAPPAPVWLAWWRADPPARVEEVVTLAQACYAADG